MSSDLTGRRGQRRSLMRTWRGFAEKRRNGLSRSEIGRRRLLCVATSICPKKIDEIPSLKRGTQGKEGDKELG